MSVELEQCGEILERLKSLANPQAVEGMARFGINPENTYGISIPVLRQLAKEIGKNHSLALELWATGVHEARLLASFIEDPKQVTEEQMEAWAKDFDSWDVVDQCCGAVFDKTAYAFKKAAEWTDREEEFVKRAGFAMMAWLAVHCKKTDDAVFLSFLHLIYRESTDNRNYVKKAVNWALRQIGKRNANLNAAAVQCAREILELDSKTAKWVANDAIRELTGPAIQDRLK